MPVDPVAHQEAEQIAREWWDDAINPYRTPHYRREKIAAAFLAILAQHREAEKLREFVEWCMATASWQGYDLHGGDMQDKAEELGLLVQVPADEAFREEYDSDEMFVVAWSQLAARRADTPTPTGEKSRAELQAFQDWLDKPPTPTEEGK